MKIFISSVVDPESDPALNFRVLETDPAKSYGSGSKPNYLSTGTIYLEIK